MPTRTVYCLHCKGKHALSGELTKDTRGRTRLAGVCKATGRRVSVAVKDDGGDDAPAKATKAPTPRKEPAVSGDTRVSGERALRVSIPLVSDAEPDLGAAWDIAEGLLDELERAAGPQTAAASAQARALSLEKAAREGKKADSVERSFGAALAKVLPYVAVRRGYTAESWNAIVPPEVAAQAGEGPGLLEQGKGILMAGAEGLFNTVSPFNLDLDGDGNARDAGETGAKILGSLGDTPAAANFGATVGRAGGQAAGQGVLSLFGG